MTGARQTIAVIIIFRKSNKNSLERRSGAYRSRMTKNILYNVRTKFRSGGRHKTVRINGLYPIQLSKIWGFHSNVY